MVRSFLFWYPRFIWSVVRTERRSKIGNPGVVTVVGQVLVVENIQRLQTSSSSGIKAISCQKLHFGSKITRQTIVEEIQTDHLVVVARDTVPAIGTRVQVCVQPASSGLPLGNVRQVISKGSGGDNKVVWLGVGGLEDGVQCVVLNELDVGHVLGTNLFLDTPKSGGLVGRWIFEFGSPREGKVGKSHLNHRKHRLRLGYRRRYWWRYRLGLGPGLGRHRDPDNGGVEGW